MKNMQAALIVFVIVLIAFGVMLTGCHGSDEAMRESETATPSQPSVPGIVEQELTAAKIVNDSLRLRLVKLEQDNRAAMAHAAELEAQMAGIKEKLSAVPPPAPKPVITNLQDGYSRALQLFRSRSYSAAGSMFQAVVDGGAPTEMLDNCYYWMGECAYGESHFDMAIEYFQKVFTFERSEKKDESQIMIANSYFSLGNKAKAKAEYERLITKFPASPFVKKAKAKLNVL